MQAEDIERLNQQIKTPWHQRRQHDGCYQTRTNMAGTQRRGQAQELLPEFNVPLHALRAAAGVLDRAKQLVTPSLRDAALCSGVGYFDYLDAE